MTENNNAKITETVYNELTADLNFLPYKDFIHDEMDGQSRSFDNENPCDILNALSLYSRATILIEQNLSSESTSAAKLIQNSLLDQVTLENQAVMEAIHPETMALYNRELETVVINQSGKDYPLNYRKWDFSRANHPLNICDDLNQLVYEANELRQQFQKEQPDQGLAEQSEEYLRYFLNCVSRSYESASDEKQPKNIIISSHQWHPSFNDGYAAIFDARIDGDKDKIIYIDKNNKLFFSYMYADKQYGTVLAHLPVPESTTVHFSPEAKKILAQNKAKKKEKNMGKSPERTP